MECKKKLQSVIETISTKSNNLMGKQKIDNSKYIDRSKKQKQMTVATKRKQIKINF